MLLQPSTPDKREWHASLGRPVDDAVYDSWSDTAPLAICLAALKAVGHPTDE